MTGTRCKCYEEIYKGRLIEIYLFLQCAPGMVSSAHLTVSVDFVPLSGTFDARSYGPSQLSEPSPSSPYSFSGWTTTPDQSSALAAAKAYCDHEAEARNLVSPKQGNWVIRWVSWLVRACFYKKDVNSPQCVIVVEF